LRKATYFLALCFLLLIIAGCEKEKATLVQKGDVTYVEEKTEDISFDEAVEDILNGEPDVYTLIDNNIRIGSRKEELEKIPMDKYSSEYDYNGFFVTSELYGYISDGIIDSFTIRLDSNPIDLDEADSIVEDLLPEDATLQNAYTEKPYKFYEYHSDSLPSPGKIEVQVGNYGGSCSVIGLTADIGNTIYITN